MGISIKLYRIKNTGNLDDVTDLETELTNAEDNQVDLYKNYQDIGMVLENSTIPLEDANLMTYKVLFGNRTEKQIGNKNVIGFIPANEIRLINEWIKSEGIDTAEGFTKKHDNLNEMVKQELIDFASPSKDELFKGYIEKLVAFYQQAEVNENAVVICAE